MTFSWILEIPWLFLNYFGYFFNMAILATFFFNTMQWAIFSKYVAIIFVFFDNLAILAIFWLLFKLMANYGDFYLLDREVASLHTLSP